MLRIRKVKMQIDIGSSSKTKHLGILISLRRLTVGRELIMLIFVTKCPTKSPIRRSDKRKRVMCYTMNNFCEKEDRDLRLIGPVELHMGNFNTMGTEELNKNINYEREINYLY